MLRFNCVDKLYRIYAEMDAWNPDGSSTDNFRSLVQQHLLFYAQLNVEAGMNNISCFWRLYPKHHLFCHVSGAANPKSEWLYAMESEIGKAVKVAASVNIQHFHRAFIQRYHDTYFEDD